MNAITILMLCIFLMPIVTGILSPISDNRIYFSMRAALNNLKYLIAILLTFYLITSAFSEDKKGLFNVIYQRSPSLQEFISLYQHDVVAYMIAGMVLLFLISWLLELIILPLYKYVLVPLIDGILARIRPMNPKIKHLLSGAAQIPKALCIVLIFSLLLNLYTTYINNPAASSYINSSKTYQAINSKVITPVLSAELVRQLPVLVSDSINRAAEDFTPGNNVDGSANYWNLPVIKYFNGMTLEEAVKSTPEIDEMAKEIVGNETNDRKKAQLLYNWISKNIDYDYDKADVVMKDSSKVNSGAIVTYTERTGICFDYACLYVAMGRAVGLKIRFVTGLGYSGVEWGDHAWNQVYDSAEDKWLNVDTTFGSSGQDFFDPADFASKHKYEVIQAEW